MIAVYICFFVACIHPAALFILMNVVLLDEDKKKKKNAKAPHLWVGIITLLVLFSDDDACFFVSYAYLTAVVCMVRYLYYC